MENNKKTINVEFAYGNDPSVIKLLEKKYNVTEDPSKPVNILIFLGGEDVDPEIYGEVRGKFTGCNRKRDDKEYHKFYTPSLLSPNVLKLGICRGSQFLTVANGGRLIQHVTNHTSSHDIETKEGHTILVTSTHHQMLYPFDINENNYEIIAWSKFFRSTTYLNGENKEINLHEDFVEPEIVYYKKYNSLAVQGHPEFNTAGEDFQDYVLNLIDKHLVIREVRDIETLKKNPFKIVKFDDPGVTQTVNGTSPFKWIDLASAYPQKEEPIVTSYGSKRGKSFHTQIASANLKNQSLREHPTYNITSEKLKEVFNDLLIEGKEK